MEACQEECKCVPVCRCAACPKVMRARLSVRSYSADPADGALEALLAAVPGVESAKSSLLRNVAEVVYDADQVGSPAALVGALRSGGFDSALSAAGPAAGARLALVAVGGMTCTACSSGVEGALRALPGVRSAAVSAVLGEARVEYDPALTTEAALVSAIEDAGFEATISSRRQACSAALLVSGVSSAACAGVAEAALQGAPGVVEATVDFPSGRAEVWFDPAVTGPRTLIAALAEAGYGAAPQEVGRGDAEAMRRRETEYWRRKFLVSLAFALPLMAVSMGLMYVPAAMVVLGRRVWGLRLLDLISLALATPVQFWVGWAFHGGALRALRRRAANMDVLVSVGTNAAYWASLSSMAYGAAYPEYDEEGTFFETSAFLICFICLGKWLESLAKGKTSQAIAQLMALAPSTALLCTVDAAGRVVHEQEIAAALIQQGDLLKVLPGARLPADGTVQAGCSHLDESMVTGEPLPVRKAPGDSVVGGTVNAGSALLVRATAVGAGSTLAQIVRAVEAAQLSKAPAQALADRLSAVFVPGVLALAAAVFAAWYGAGLAGLYPPCWLPPGTSPLVFALKFGISVVVIACPCALGLALPTALMVGTGVGASRGVLIKSAEALERAQALQAVVFDKTGTLTAGRPAVVDERCVDPQLPRETWLLLAASAESGSEHPLADAIVAHAATALGLADGLEGGPAVQPTGQLAHGGSADDAVAGVEGQRSKQRSKGSSNGLELAQPLLEGYSEEPAVLAVPPADAAGKGRSVGWVLPVVREERVDGAGLVSTLSVPLAALPSSLAQRPAAAGASSVGVANGASAPQQQKPSGGVAAQQQQDGGVAAAGGLDVEVALGNRRLMAARGVAIDAGTAEWMAAAQRQGRTCVLLAVAGRLAAGLAITDPIKPEAPGVVAALHAMGLRTAMLTGDNAATARAVAAQCGVGRVMAEVPPAGKAEHIRRMQEQEGLVVGMVGDGINDSPALAQADVGFAVGGGAAIAAEAAGFVLVRSNLADILLALDLSRAIFACIRRNYAWALGYNLLMIPLAAGALYPSPLRLALPPWLAGAAMAFSSLSVVASSLALRRYRYRPPRGTALGQAPLRTVVVVSTG